MRKFIFAVLAAATMSLTGCGLLSNLNPQGVMNAAGDLITAASITDAQVVELSRQSMAYTDAENYILTSGPYVTRLNNLTKNLKVEGLPLNFKVYKTDEINAFACGDGSIRIYSGLMDVMDDDQLIAIIGHEIGHVVHQDTKAALKRAYMSAAAREIAGSVDGTIGVLSNSVLGDLAQQFVEARYSQKQEYAADDYGFQFAVDNGHDAYSMYSALMKLVELSGGSTTSSQVYKMFSSHPDSEKRAEKVKAKADAMTKK